MSFAKKLGVVVALMASLAAGAWAQRGGGMGPRAPSMPMTWFNAVEGSGAQYNATVMGKTSSFTFVVLGKENVEGKDGYWIEIRSEGGPMPGEMVMKALTVVNEGKGEVKRMIMQMAGAAPMEMPMGMMSMAKQQQPAADAGGPGEKVGTESVTVPAGTFDCDHYQKKDMQGKTVDSWVSTKVVPYGLVKMTTAEMTLELKKTLSNETSHIKGEPTAMPSFPH
jgi:hypothetical protein